VHDLLIAPHWQQVTAAVAADRAARVHALARSGLGALLTSVPGVAGWDGQTLELAYPSTRTVRLAGRGLTLVPSYFCTRAPVTLIDPELPPVLIYPANHGAGRSAVTDGASQRLVALLGRTRADCLAALDTPCTTSGLAARLGTTVGTASKHAAVLRDARLVESRRTGGAVQHHRTRLGEALLLAGGTHEL